MLFLFFNTYIYIDAFYAAGPSTATRWVGRNPPSMSALVNPFPIHDKGLPSNSGSNSYSKSSQRGFDKVVRA